MIEITESRSVEDLIDCYDILDFYDWYDLLLEVMPSVKERKEDPTLEKEYFEYVLAKLRDCGEVFSAKLIT